MMMRISMQAFVAVLSAGAACAAPNLARLPLSFESGIRSSEFVAHAGGLSLTVTPTGASIALGRMHLEGSRPNASAQPEQKLPGYTNYLLDRDPHKWRTHVPNFARVRYHNVYPGIDVVYYGNPRQLEFDFILSPGADPRRIQIALSSPDLQIRLPRIYQNDHAIEGRAVRHGNRVTFEVAAYDHSKQLVIDPVLSYASIFGGGGSDEGRAIAVDSSGAVYVAGNAFDQNFPVVNGKSTGATSFLAKLNPAGNAVVFSTYLPLNNLGQASYAVDASGSLYMTRGGLLGSPLAGSGSLIQCRTIFQDVYVAKLSPDGSSLVYGGCIGGSLTDMSTAIAVDAAGNAYVTGSTQSSDFPLVNPLQSSYPDTPYANEAFLFKLSPGGTLLYSTFLGVITNPPLAVAADPAGNAYVAGITGSVDFPLKNAIQSRFTGISSPFAAKINADGSNLVYSTYFGGGSVDQISAIAADASGNTYLAGSTVSADFPTTANAFERKFNGISAFKTTDGAADWSQSDSGLSGTASSVTVDPRNPSTIYAVSSNRVFKSSDHGATWKPTSASQASRLWIDPVDSTLFVSTVQGDLLRSRDAGATFSTVDSRPFAFINDMAFDSGNPSLIYARWGGTGQGDGVFKTTDGGDSWNATSLSGPGTGSGGLAIDPAHPSALYVSTHKGLLRSDDGGDTFTTVNASIMASQLLFDSASTLYAVSNSGAGNASVLINSGNTFISKALPGTGGTLVIDPTNNSTWYLASLGPNGIYKSTDGGDSWQPVSNGLPDPKATGSLALDPSSPATLYLGATPASDAFFAKLSPDGAVLKYATYLGGIGGDSATAVAVDASGNAYIAGTNGSPDFPIQTPFRTTGTGFLAKFDATNQLQWSSLIGDAAPVALALGPVGEVYLTGSSSSASFPTPDGIGPFISGNVFGTSDGGTTWNSVSLPNTIPGASTLSGPLLAADPQRPSRLYALADYLYVTDNGGQDWTKLGTPGIPIFGLLALVLDPVNSTTIYSTGPTSLRPISGGVVVGGVYKSTDGGLNWTFSPIATSTADTPAFIGGPAIVGGLAIDPRTPSTVYAAILNGGIFKSTDAATTWKSTGPLPAAVGTAVAVDLLNPAVLYASGAAVSIPPVFNGSLYKSLDAGATWSPINNGLPSGWFANFLIPDRTVPGRVYAARSDIIPSPFLPPTFLPPGPPPSSNLIYRTDDGGNSWMPIGSGLPDWPIASLAVDPINSALVYVAPRYGGLYRSTDAGETFTVVPGMQVPIVGSIAIDPSNPSNIYTGTFINPGDAFVMKIVQ
jgi:photosystem II stability/assembly factor-like uncharacterized protein